MNTKPFVIYISKRETCGNFYFIVSYTPTKGAKKVTEKSSVFKNEKEMINHGNLFAILENILVTNFMKRSDRKFKVLFSNEFSVIRYNSGITEIVYPMSQDEIHHFFRVMTNM